MGYTRIMQTSARKQLSPEVRAARLSLGVAVVLLGVKTIAWLLTGSAAILSDALESIINLVAAGFAVVSVSVAETPPDERHPYGHGNIEYYAAWLEGSLIMLASVGIFWESWDKIFHPAPMPHLGAGIALLVAAGGVNLWLGLRLLRQGKRSGSLTLTADGQHVLTDVYTSAGVFVGLGLVLATGWLWLDGLVACLVGINIAWTGVGLVRRSVAGFMNESDRDLLSGICALLRETRHPSWIDVHRLRAIKSGRRIHVDLHLILPRDMPLHEAHDQVEAMEALLRGLLGPEADIMIHADPCENGRCPTCNADPCDLRQSPPLDTACWSMACLVDPSRKD
jgi:cation diffusion facilitator family transporter